MADAEELQLSSTADDRGEIRSPSTAVHRTTRRRLLKGAVVTGGSVVAASYVKPSVRSLGVPTATAASLVVTTNGCVGEHCDDSLADCSIDMADNLEVHCQMESGKRVIVGTLFIENTSDGWCVIKTVEHAVATTPAPGCLPASDYDNTTLVPTSVPALAPLTPIPPAGQSFTFKITGSESDPFQIGEHKVGVQVAIYRTGLVFHGGLECAEATCEV